MSLRHWFQNLNDDGRHWFHFRGSFLNRNHQTLLRYSLWSGRALRLEYAHGAGDEREATLSIGLGFVTIHLGVPLPDKWCFKRKCIATWDNNREFYVTDGRRYGFYWREWALVWFWHQREHESGNGPWWRYFYFHLDDFIWGRTEYMTHDITEAENVQFKLGGKTFVMNSIRWYDATWFRRRIPIALYANKMVRVEMKIDKPPMRAGKGENSWDCGDDGSFGLTMSWNHKRPNWLDKSESVREAIREYADNALKDAKRYGAGGGEQGIRASDQLEFVDPPVSPLEPVRSEPGSGR